MAISSGTGLNLEGHCCVTASSRQSRSFVLQQTAISLKLGTEWFELSALDTATLMVRIFSLDSSPMGPRL